MKLRKGNVFTSVCQEFCPWGCLPDTPLERLGRHPPPIQTRQTPPGQADTPPGRQTPHWEAETPSRQKPPDQTPPVRHPNGQTPQWADTPLDRHPLGRHTPRQADTPPGRKTPHWQADTP